MEYTVYKTPLLIFTNKQHTYKEVIMYLKYIQIVNFKNLKKARFNLLKEQIL